MKRVITPHDIPLEGFDSADLSLPKNEGKKGAYQKCSRSHPVIQLGKGTLQGGSCYDPIIKDADIYVGLDSGMHFKHPNYPWLPHEEKGPVEVLFRVADGTAPSDEKNFKAMIQWLKQNLEAGKKVHVGCIGGHGRTGMVIAALVKEMLGEKDAIGWVRENYCKKAVETEVQIKFLMKAYEIAEAKPIRNRSLDLKGSGYGGHHGPYSTYSTYGGMQGTLPLPNTEAWSEYIQGTNVLRAKGPRDLVPVSKKEPLYVTAIRSPNSIWGDV